MQYFLYAITGITGGVLGGMGMGGGTVLIPLLSILFNVSQHTAQAINLIAFIPMAVISLIIHFKNKMIDLKGISVIIVFGLLSCFVGSYIAKAISGETLKRIFGGFLMLLSFYTFFSGIKQSKK